MKTELHLMPRERMLALGAKSLNDAELLAIVLRTGTTGMNVLQLAEHLITQCGGLYNLLSQQPLPAIKGIGKAKSAELMAIIEISKRALLQKVSLAPVLDNPRLVCDYLKLHFSSYINEAFIALWLDNSLNLIKIDKLFEGTLTYTHIYPREVVAKGLSANASNVIFAHNHPSGSIKPSHADRQINDMLEKILQTVEIKLLDHFIVTRETIFSMEQNTAFNTSNNEHIQDTLSVSNRP